jgi:hypothetical protein
LKADDADKSKGIAAAFFASILELRKTISTVFIWHVSGDCSENRLKRFLFTTAMVTGLKPGVN